MKRKTSKSAQKRFKVSGAGKVMRRPVNSSHFNAKDNGNERQRKRGLQEVSGADTATMRSLLPYS